MKENEKTDYREASPLYQMDSEKSPSEALHHWQVLLLFKVNVNFRIKKKESKVRKDGCQTFYISHILYQNRSEYISMKVVNIFICHQF